MVGVDPELDLEVVPVGGEALGVGVGSPVGGIGEVLVELELELELEEFSVSGVARVATVATAVLAAVGAMEGVSDVNCSKYRNKRLIC